MKLSKSQRTYQAGSSHHLRPEQALVLLEPQETASAGKTVGQHRRFQTRTCSPRPHWFGKEVAEAGLAVACRPH